MLRIEKGFRTLSSAEPCRNRRILVAGHDHRVGSRLAAAVICGGGNGGSAHTHSGHNTVAGYIGNTGIAGAVGYALVGGVGRKNLIAGIIDLAHHQIGLAADAHIGDRDSSNGPCRCP